MIFKRKRKKAKNKWLAALSVCFCCWVLHSHLKGWELIFSFMLLSEHLCPVWITFPGQLVLPCGEEEIELAVKSWKQMIARLAFVHLSRKWHWVVGLWSSVKKNCRCISIAQTFWTHIALWWSSVKMFVNLQASLLQGSCLGSQWIWVWKPGGLAFWGCSELVLPEWTPGLVAWHPWSWLLSNVDVPVLEGSSRPLTYMKGSVLEGSGARRTQSPPDPAWKGAGSTCALESWQQGPGQCLGQQCASRWMFSIFFSEG